MNIELSPEEVKEIVWCISRGQEYYVLESINASNSKSDTLGKKVQFLEEIAQKLNNL